MSRYPYFDKSGSLNDPDMPEPVLEWEIRLIPVNEENEEDPVKFTGLHSDAIEQARVLAKNAPYRVARTDVVRTK